MTDLRVIPYVRVPVTPLPEVIAEGNTEADWQEWERVQLPFYDAASGARLSSQEIQR